MMSHVLRCAACWAGAAILVCSAPAQEGGAKDVLVLDAVVVAGKRAPAQGEAEPIPGAALRTHKVVDLAEILADELVEATMIRKAGYGNEVSLRGFGKSNLRISLDGSIVEGACGGRKDPSLSHLNLLEIERIEVREGPFDVIHAGALGGGIEVQSREPEAGFHGEFLTKAGSFGYLNTGGYVTGGNDWIQALVGYGYAESDQYEDGDGNQLSTFTTNPYLPRYEDRKAFRKQDFWGKLRLTPSPQDTFLFSYSHGEAKDILYPRGPFDIPSERTSLARASYTRTDLGTWSDELSLSLYRNLVEHDPSQEYRRGGTAAPQARSRITGGTLRNVQSSEFATFTYGVDTYERRWHAEVFHAFSGNLLNPRLIPDVRTWNAGAFLEVDKDLGNLSLQAGGRIDWQRSKAARQLAAGPEAGAKPTRRETAPSGFLSATYPLGERAEIFGGVGRSVRMPNGVERYLQGGPGQYGNPDLQPTRNTEADLGVGYAAERFEIRAKIFYSDLRDYIYQEVDGGAATWANIDARIYGGDANAKVHLGGGWSVQAAVALQRGTKRDQPNGNDDRDLAEIPPWKSKLGLAYESKRLTAELEWIHSGKASRVDLAAGETALSSWDVLNLRLGYQISETVALHAGVNNLLDQDYAVANSYEWDVIAGAAAVPAIVDEPGRFLYASLSYSF